MHRNKILDLLKSYSRKYEVEKTLCERFILFVQNNENCFERALEEGHITASAFVINMEETHVLLVHHKKLQKWLQPGGHADGEKDVLSVAMKEVYEETGLEKIEPVMENIFDIDIHLIPKRKQEKEHYHYDVRFLLKSVGSDKYYLSDESNALSWIRIESIHNYTTEPSILRMVEKLKNN